MFRTTQLFQMFASPQTGSSPLDAPSRINDFLLAVCPPAHLNWAQHVLQAIQTSETGVIIPIFSDSTSPSISAIGTVTRSIHALNHWGISLLGIHPAADRGEVIDELCFRSNQFIAGSTIEPGSAKAISLATSTPAPFKKHGFEVIHTHSDNNGASIYWMMRVEGTNVEYMKVGVSEPTVAAAAHADVVPIVIGTQIAQAVRVISRVWGDDQVKPFLDDFSVIQRLPGSQLYGVEVEGEIRSVGMIVKALHSSQAWSRAWISTDVPWRGHGIAEKLIQTLLYHADNHHRTFTSDPVIMEGHTFIPHFYKKFGNQVVATCDHNALTENNAQTGKEHWTMRITKLRY